MKIRVSFGARLSLLLLCLVIVQQSLGQTTQRKFYEHQVIASTTPNLEFFAAPSINDYGDVAFSARRTPGGGTVFLSEIGQPLLELLPGSGANLTQFVGGRVQTNNLQKVIQHTFISGTNPSQTYLRRINALNDYTIIAYANGAGGFNDFDQIYPSSISMNSLGETVFLTRRGNNTTILTTGERPNFSEL